MNPKIVRSLFSKENWSIVELMKSAKQSSRTTYATIKTLESLGIVNVSKGSIQLLKTPSRFALQELIVDGLDASIFDRRGLQTLVFLLKPRTIQEITKELRLSYPQTMQILNRFANFLSKNDDQYQVPTQSRLRTFLSQTEIVLNQGTIWKGNGLSLSKIPLDATSTGARTGFSRFTEFGIQIESPVQYVILPAQELTLEQILVHAIKFAENKNDMALCTIFYLKKKAQLSIPLIEKEAKRVETEKHWNDLVAWLEDHTIKQPELFLPKKEFQEKAAIYHVLIPPRYDIQTARDIFDQLNQTIQIPIKVYLIGGSALLEHKLKTSTKDIDLVVNTQPEAKELARSLQKIGYRTPTTVEKQYAQLKTAFIMEKKDSPRFDVFVKTVCNCLEFSSRMQKRSQPFITGKLNGYYASPEDILLLKSVSSRDADVTDNLRILEKKELNWKTIENEIKEQEKNLKQLNELTILEHLETLEKTLSVRIPLVKKLTHITLEKSLLLIGKKPVTINEIREKIDFPEYTIRNTINRLVKNKKMSQKTVNGKITYQTKNN